MYRVICICLCSLAFSSSLVADSWDYWEDDWDVLEYIREHMPAQR